MIEIYKQSLPIEIRISHRAELEFWDTELEKVNFRIIEKQKETLPPDVKLGVII